MNATLSRCSAMIALLVGITSAGIAQDGQPLERFDNWDLHVFDGPNGKICVVASQPSDSRPTNVLRDPVLFMVTDWPTDGIQNEIQAQMGYPLATEVSVTVDDGPTFTMTNVVNEDAWLSSAVEDDLLTAAMKRGRTMVVRARSTRGTDTIDTFSLIGISRALARSAEECA